jgi:Flp pilus assembly protein TadB
MLTTTTGRLVLLYAAGSIALGYFVLMKIADIDI